MDHLVPPGSWQKDDGEWQGEQPPMYRDMLAGILLVLNPYAQTGHGDAADPDAQREDLLRLLRQCGNHLQRQRRRLCASQGESGVVGGDDGEERRVKRQESRQRCFK